MLVQNIQIENVDERSQITVTTTFNKVVQSLMINEFYTAYITEVIHNRIHLKI